MEKEPIFKKRRVCEPSAAGTGASTSGTSSVASGQLTLVTLRAGSKRWWRRRSGHTGGQKQLR